MTERNFVRQQLQRAGSGAAKASLAAALALSMTPALALAQDEEVENEKEAAALTATNNDATASEASTDEETPGSAAQYSMCTPESRSVQLHASGAYDLAKIADGTYSGTAYASASDPLNKKDDWGVEGYDVTVDVTVASGKIAKVEVSDYSDLSDDNWDYMNRADEGYENKKAHITYTGVPEQIESAGNTNGVDAVSTATISSNAIVSAVDNALQAAYDAQNPVAAAAPAAGTYIMMNIPFAQFYATETPNNDVAVDVFTSATKTKPRNGSLAFGSYHVDESGDAINGISFPVLVTESAAENIDWSKYAQLTDEASVEITVSGKGNVTTTVYEGKDALFEAADYAFYQLGSASELGTGAPANYKELSAGEDGTLSFSEVKGAAATSIADEGATFTADTHWGDYELDLSASLNEEGGALYGATIYGVVVNTADGTGYGMRHIENIWRTTDLAWGTGFTTSAKECPIKHEHYESMMGKTIKSATYFTSNGVFEISVGGEKGFYVPVKSHDATVEAENVSVEADGESPVLTAEVKLPDDFEPAYQIDGEDVTPQPSARRAAYTVSFDASGLSLGTHTLTVRDTSGKYADISSDFSAETSKVVARFDADQLKLVAADGSTPEELASYLGSITTVTVNGTAYNATGRKGVVKIFDAEGKLLVDAVDGNKKPVFGTDGVYSLEITADGYSTNLQASYEKKAAGGTEGEGGNGGDEQQPGQPDKPSNPDGDENPDGAQPPADPSEPDPDGSEQPAGDSTAPGADKSQQDDKQGAAAAGSDVKSDDALAQTGDSSPLGLAAGATGLAALAAAAAAFLRRRVAGL